MRSIATGYPIVVFPKSRSSGFLTGEGAVRVFITEGGAIFKSTYLRFYSELSEQISLGIIARKYSKLVVHAREALECPESRE